MPTTFNTVVEGIVGRTIGSAALGAATIFGGTRALDRLSSGTPNQIEQPDAQEDLTAIGKRLYSVYIRDLKRHEGFRHRKYKDTLGHWTIGYGHKILPTENFDTGITKQQGETMLREDAQDAWVSAMKLMHRNGVKLTPTNREQLMRVIPNMVFQMDTRGVSKFKNMWTALAVGDYNKAADEMLDSRWHKQTPNRSKELANIIRSIK